MVSSRPTTGQSQGFESPWRPHTPRLLLKRLYLHPCPKTDTDPASLPATSNSCCSEWPHQATQLPDTHR